MYHKLATLESKFRYTASYSATLVNTMQIGLAKVKYHRTYSSLRYTKLELAGSCWLSTAPVSNSNGHLQQLIFKSCLNRWTVVSINYLLLEIIISELDLWWENTLSTIFFLDIFLIIQNVNNWMYNLRSVQVREFEKY